VTPAAFVADAGSSPTPPRYTREAKPARVKLGEPFDYEVTLEHPGAERYELLAPSEDALAPFDLLEHTRARQDQGGQAKTTFHLKMALYDVGVKRIPDVFFEAVTPAGTRKFVLPGVDVEGVSSLPAASDQKGAALEDIKPPRDVPVRSWRLVYVLLGLLAAAALGYGLRRFLKRPKIIQARKVPPVPLDVRTRQALQDLSEQRLPALGKSQEFFFRLSEIVRGYLGERYGFEALECTGPELLSRIQVLKARELPEEELRRFVLESELVKFARQEVSEDACDQALEFGHQLVVRTWQSPQPPNPEGHAPGSRLS
jgi:hypothetical protein